MSFAWVPCFQTNPSAKQTFGATGTTYTIFGDFNSHPPLLLICHIPGEREFGGSPILGTPSVALGITG